MAVPSIDDFVFGEQLSSSDMNAILDDLGTLYAGGVADGSIAEAKLATAIRPYVLLATASPSGANVSWTGISGSYTHLRVICTLQGSDASTRVLNMNLNNDSGANYDMEIVAWNNATASGSGTVGQTTAAFGTVPPSGASPRAFSYEMIFPFYSQTSTRKNAFATGMRSAGTAAGDQFLEHRSMHYRSTSAISRIDFAPSTGNFASGSEFRLYGIE